MGSPKFEALATPPPGLASLVPDTEQRALSTPLRPLKTENRILITPLISYFLAFVAIAL